MDRYGFSYYPLDQVKESVRRGNVKHWGGPIRDALKMGMGTRDIEACILQLEKKMCYKHTTQNNDHKIWLDVYHLPHEGIVLYIKYKVESQTVIVTSFKPKDEQI